MKFVYTLYAGTKTYLRDGSLITYGEGVEDIFDEIFVPPVRFIEVFWHPLQEFTSNSIFLLVKCSLFFIPSL